MRKILTESFGDLKSTEHPLIGIRTWRTKPNKDNADKAVLGKIGRWIKTFRQLKGLTQKQLGDLLHLSQNHLSNIEAGKREPGILLLLELGQALDVPVHLLLMPAFRPSSKDGAKNELAKDFQAFVVSLIDEIGQTRQP